MAGPAIPTHLPEHPFARYIRILGKGKTGTRSMDQDEARAAFGMILRQETEPLQLGAFLMLLRVKEESPEELAGFVQACRDVIERPPRKLSVDLDWSSYAGKRHQHPWYILAMLLLSGAGYRVFVHGSRGHTPGRLYTEDALRQLQLPVASDWAEVERQLDDHHLSYLPLERLCPVLQDLLLLRPLLGLRSPVNTLARMLNPLGATASIQSVFHPAYARLHQEADLLLAQHRALVFKGESGEVEVKPQADTEIHLLQQGKLSEWVLPRQFVGRPARVNEPDIAGLKRLWSGTALDDYGLQATLLTTAAALVLLEPGLIPEKAADRALELWQGRDRARLA